MWNFEASGFAQSYEASEASGFGALPGILKQVASPEALKLAKLVALELSASKTEARLNHP